jgi:hypothetical protein
LDYSENEAKGAFFREGILWSSSYKNLNLSRQVYDFISLF